MGIGKGGWFKIDRPPEPEGMKFCIKCREMKAIDLFYDHPKTYDGKSPHCKECQRGSAYKSKHSPVV